MKKWLNYKAAIKAWVNDPKKLFFGSLGLTTLLTIILLIISFIDMSVANRSAVTLKAMRSMLFNAVSCIVILLANVLGWYGGYARHKCMLAVYETIMVIPTVGELFNVRLLSELDQEIEKAVLVRYLDEVYQDYLIDSEARESIDAMHTYFQCCGSESPKKVDDFYPASCCKNIEKDKCIQPFKLGCADAIIQNILPRLRIEGAFGVSLFIGCIVVTCAGDYYRRLLSVL